MHRLPERWLLTSCHLLPAHRVILGWGSQDGGREHIPQFILRKRKEQRGARNRSRKARTECPGQAAQCHTWAVGLYFKCCVANICRMKSKLGEGEGAGRWRCSKLGAELRQGWLLGADGGRARAGACVRCAAATPALAVRSRDERPHGGGAKGAHSPPSSRRGGGSTRERWLGKKGEDPRAAASQAEEPASSAAPRRPPLPLGTAPGTLVTPKIPQSSARLQGSLPSEEELHHLPFTDREGEGWGETLPSPRQSKQPSPATLLACGQSSAPAKSAGFCSPLPDQPRKSCRHLAALCKMLTNSAPAPGRAARL